MCASGVVNAPLAETLSFFLLAPVGDQFLNGSDLILPSLIGGPAPRPPKA
jgi:hypothetical protein